MFLFCSQSHFDHNYLEPTGQAVESDFKFTVPVHRNTRTEETEMLKGTVPAINSKKLI